MKFSNSPIDFERLREVSGSDSEIFFELVELYFSETEKQLGELKIAVGEKNFDLIHRTTHKMLGGSLTCGMNEIVSPLKSLEQSGKNQGAENIEQFFKQAMQSFERMKKFFNASKSEIFN